MDQNRDDRLADLITEHALNPDMRPPSWVTPTEWAEVEQLAVLERGLRIGAYAAPQLADDRAAALLGLIPDGKTQLARTSLKRARKSAKTSVSDVAKRLAARGWDVTAADVFRWENQGAPEMPPALVEAIATVLHANVTELTEQRFDAQKAVLDVTVPAYRQLVERLAGALGVTADFAAARLQTAASTAVHRGDRPQEEQLLATLEAYVRAMERRNEH